MNDIGLVVCVRTKGRNCEENLRPNGFGAEGEPKVFLLDHRCKSMTLDLLIKKARIVDGTGAPWFRGSVGVRDGEIVEITRKPSHSLTAETVINADGDVVAPGFIDAHSHSDLEAFSDPTLAPKTRQGITTEIIGQDGFSMAPLYSDDGATEWQEYLRGLTGSLDRTWTWERMSEYLDAIDETGTSLNLATLVGHGTVRYNVLGMDDTQPTEAELEEMAEQVAEGLADGAIGFSTGLVYTPQIYSETSEVRRLASELAPYGRPFVAHIRSEGRWIWEALDEFLDIGVKEGIPLHISHFKVTGREQQGKADRAVELVETARERGVDVTADQYPYTAGSSMLSALLPPWIESRGPERMLEELQDPNVRQRIRRDIEEWRIDGWENVAGKTGWDSIQVTNLSGKNSDIDGAFIADVADDRGVTPVDVVCDVLIEEELNANMIAHGLIEPDVQQILTSEYVAVGTDGLFGGRPHPRVYGTFPRILGRYVRAENLLSLEEAVRMMTSLPARAMGLDHKGVIRPGMDADLVVFDPAIVADCATFDSPTKSPDGIRHVFVDGECVVRNGETTDATPGGAIRK